MRFLYINPDENKQARATTLGCGWMATVPSEYANIAMAPCVILSGAGTTVVISDTPPTTKAAVTAAAAPILAAEQAAQAADATRIANGETLRAKATQALATNAAYLAQPAIPGGTLTAAQLGAALRIVRAQLDATTKQNNAIIRLTLNQLDNTDGT
jgi:Zn-dependent alcohol dehydrogenase